MGKQIIHKKSNNILILFLLLLAPYSCDFAQALQIKTRLNTIQFLQQETISSDYKLSKKQESFAKIAINLGKLYLSFIYNNQEDKIPGANNPDSLKLQRNISKTENNQGTPGLISIVSICWYLFSLAVEKDQGFTSGMIVLQDNNNRLYKFLLNYCLRVNPSLLNSSLSSLYNFSGVPSLQNLSSSLSPSYYSLAYSRISTHFQEIKNNPDYQGQFGIDIRFSQYGKRENILPANKSHILFGKLPKQINNNNQNNNYAGMPSDDFMFLKFETYGLCPFDGSFFMHMAELLKVNLWGNAKNFARRETVPSKIMKNYKKILNELIALDNLSTKEKEYAKNINIIRDIYKYLKNLISQNKLNKNMRKKINKLLHKLEKDNNYDYLELRRGYEVILVN